MPKASAADLFVKCIRAARSSIAIVISAMVICCRSKEGDKRVYRFLPPVDPRALTSPGKHTLCYLLRLSLVIGWLVVRSAIASPACNINIPQGYQLVNPFYCIY